MQWDPEIVHGRREHALLRWGLGLTILFAFLWRGVPATDQLYPKGIANFLDLTFLNDRAIYWSLIALAAVAVVTYGLGRSFVVSLGYLFVLCMLIFTYSMSHIEKTRHDTNILPLVLLGQLIGHFHWMIVERRGDTASRFGRRRREDLAVYYGMQMICVLYVLSGITKLVKTGGDWIDDCPLVALQIVRAQHNEFYSFLTPEGGLQTWLDFGNYLVQHKTITRLVFGSSLVLELGAFVALMGRKPALCIGASLIAFHLSVYYLMNINFYLNVIVLALFVVNVPYWLVRRKDAATAPMAGPATP